MKANFQDLTEIQMTYNFSLFPLPDHSKIPKIKWKEAASPSVEFIDEQIQTIGLVAGRGRFHNLFVIDFDKQGEDLKAARDIIVGEYNLPENTLTVNTPRGGCHLYYLIPDEQEPLTQSVSKLLNGVDTRGEGGYVVAPGSVVEKKDGTLATYNVDGDIEIAMISQKSYQLLKTILDKGHYEKKKASETSFDQTVIEERINSYLSNIPHGSIGEGKRNNDLLKMALKFRDFGGDDPTIEFGINWCNQHLCSSPLGPDEIGALLYSVKNSDWENERGCEYKIKEQCEIPIAKKEVNQTPMPELWGLPLEIYNHIIKRSVIPSPILAMGSTIAIVAAVASQARVFVRCGPFATYPNLYTLNLAPTGSGKDDPQKALSQLAYMLDLNGSGDYRSDASLINSFYKKVKDKDGQKTVVNEKNITRLDILPECSGLFKRMSDPKQTHMGSINQTFCELFTVGDQDYYPPRYSQDLERPPILGPSFNFHGISQPESMADCFSSESFYSGLAGRMLIFSQNKPGEFRKDIFSGGYNKRDFENIIVKIEALRRYFDDSSLPRTDRKWYNMLPPVDSTQYNIFTDLYSEILKEYQDKITQSQLSWEKAIYSRASMMIMRIALGLAVFDKKPHIEIKEIIFARQLFEHLIFENRALYERASFTTQSEKDMEDLFLRIKRGCQKNNGKVYLSYLRNKSKKISSSGRFDKLLNELEKAGRIVIQDLITYIL